MSKKTSKNSDTLIENLVDVNRVTKVVEGGRNFSFSAIVVVGDQNGKVGRGIGKAKEVSGARDKATKDARRNLMSVPLYKGRTIYHDIVGTSGAAKVLLRRASPGTGIIAGGPMRAIFTCLGVEDIVAKSLGSSNSNAMISATLDALSKLSSPKKIAERRGKAIFDISTIGNNKSNAVKHTLNGGKLGANKKDENPSEEADGHSLEDSVVKSPKEKNAPKKKVVKKD